MGVAVAIAEISPRFARLVDQNAIVGDRADQPIDVVAGPVADVLAAFGGQRLIAENLEVAGLVVLVIGPERSALETQPGGIVRPIAAGVDLADAGGTVRQGETVQVERACLAALRRGNRRRVASGLDALATLGRHVAGQRASRGKYWAKSVRMCRGYSRCPP